MNTRWYFHSHFEFIPTRPSGFSVVVCLAAHNPEFPGWTPVTVKLFQSPGRAGGFPTLVNAEVSPGRGLDASSLRLTDDSPDLAWQVDSIVYPPGFLQSAPVVSNNISTRIPYIHPPRHRLSSSHCGTVRDSAERSLNDCTQEWEPPRV